MKTRPHHPPANRSLRRALHRAGEVPRRCHKASPTGQGEARMLLSGLKGFAQTAGEDTTPPGRVLVIPWGTHQTAEGPVICDAGTLKVLPGRQKAARNDRIPIDFDHSTAFGKDMGKPRHIAGYGTAEVVEGEGVYLANIRWTPEGRQFWANYEDLSPAFLQQKGTGRVTFLDSVALTPRGVIEGLTLFSAEAEPTQINQSTTPTAPKLMDIVKLKAYLTKKGLKFADDADLETLMSLVEGVMDKEIGGPAEEAPAEMSAKVAKLEADLARVMAADATRTATSETAAKADIIRQASAEGKVLPPDSVIKNMSAEDLRLTSANTPVTVRLTPGSPLNPTEKGGGEKAVTLSAEDLLIAGQAGITEETMKRFHTYGEAPVRLG